MKAASRLKRPIHAMPAFVREALTNAGLESAYDSRPPYQRNDYIGWIAGAKLQATQQRRLQQMLEELARGDVYMKMPYRGKAEGAPADKSARRTQAGQRRLPGRSMRSST